MEIAKKYNPTDVEGKWYDYWLENKFFHSTPDERKPFTIVIPPPNVTGVLHLGHTLNNTIQDLLCRRARMMGMNPCWVPGTDHASIATENKVLQKLEEEGINKKDITRDEFMKHAWEWKDKYGGIILKQLRTLGASCDWDRTNFTMDDHYYKSVIHVFVDLYNKGLIYKGVRMVNWDPKRKTALSDEEVYYKEVNSKLYHVKYQVEGTDEFLTIATTRPETILGDTAICVHPEDERYTHLHGKKAIVPMVERPIPIICDEYVDREFGTGALKVTPAHDINDYELGMKHNPESIEILDDEGCLNEAAQFYVGQDRFKVRKQIAKDLEEKGALVDVKEIQNKVSYSERSHAVIEPKLSMQWFCKMGEMADAPLEEVMNDSIRFVPPHMVNTYKHWMENIKDWCISRQLWWGQRIPAFYYGSGYNDYVVAKTEEEALKLAQEKSGKSDLTTADLRQDDDVLDTWFSSWLWPIAVFNGILEPDNEEIKYYYPTNVLVTGQDIIFFWVARMIMAGLEYKQEKPFDAVYFTGMVRDKQGRKMSKSLGNSPDLFKMIEQYSADGVRAGVLFSSPAGNDLLFDEKECEQGRNFNNKMWNALRLIKGWEVVDADQPHSSKKAIEWITSRMNQSILRLNDHFEKYRISDGIMELYKLIWENYCNWFLEMVKPDFGKPIDRTTYDTVVELYEEMMKLLHPFMPFITEEIWQILKDRKGGESIMMESWPQAGEINEEIIAQAETAKEAITNVRNIRNQQGLSPKEQLELFVSTKSPETYEQFGGVIAKMANTADLVLNGEKPENAKSFLVGTDELYVPVSLDVEAEKSRIQKEIDYNKGFLVSVSKKLSNERFVNNAPEQVVAAERKKQADAEEKIKKLEESLASLG